MWRKHLSTADRIKVRPGWWLRSVVVRCTCVAAHACCVRGESHMWRSLVCSALRSVYSSVFQPACVYASQCRVQDNLVTFTKLCV
jgi:hypothetical protein